jgi:hypothetical protein
MLADDIADRIAIAHPDELDELVKNMWTSHTHGLLTENEIEGLDEAARARREAIQERRTETRPTPRAAVSSAPRGPARRRQRSPDKRASIERRRRLAASGPMPPALAAKFTVSELAVLRVAGEEVLKHGACTLCVDALAAMAGTCPTVVRSAFDVAEGLALVTVQERRRPGQRSLTNVIHIISAEWLTWLRKGSGSRKSGTTNTRYSDTSTRKPDMVSGYRSKRLSDGRYRPSAEQKGYLG